MTLRIAHLSDVHIQIDFKSLPLSRVGWRRALARIELEARGRARWFAGAEATLRQLSAAAFAQADHVLLTGDLTALSTDTEFEMALEALGPGALDPQRFSVIPGNHDRYTLGSIRKRRFERVFGHLLASDLPKYAVDGVYPFVRLVGSELAVVGLDSTRLAPFPGLAWGRVPAAQLRALDALLKDPALEGRAVAVMVHHAPFTAAGTPDAVIHGLHGAESLLRVLRGRATALFHGHIHRRYRHEGTTEHPPIFCAGSSTMGGREGGWFIDFDQGALVGARELAFEKRAGAELAARWSVNPDEGCSTP